MRVIQNTPNLLILSSGPFAQLILATSIILSGFIVGLIASRLIPSLSVDPGSCIWIQEM